MAMKINVLLDSFNKIYREGETMVGTVEITSKEESSYNHITAVLIGQYTIKNNKATPSQTHIIKFYNKSVKIAENGKILPNKTNSFNLKLPISYSEDNPIYESYQGVIVSITVSLV